MARFDKVLTLLAVETTQDDIGNPVETVTERTVFARELAVYNTTYYNAAATGLRPERMFELWRREYQGEPRVKYEGITYRVIRTALGDSPERLVLTCERVSADE